MKWHEFFKRLTCFLFLTMIVFGFSGNSSAAIITVNNSADLYSQFVGSGDAVSGDTIRLGADVEIRALPSGRDAGLAVKRNLTLDLYGKTLDIATTLYGNSNGIKIYPGCELTIEDSSALSNGQLNVDSMGITSHGYGAGINTTDGTLIIKSGTVTAVAHDGAAIGGGSGRSRGEGVDRAYNGGTVIISGGTVVATGATAAGIGGGYGGAGGDGGTIIITGGTVTASGTNGGAGIGGGAGSWGTTGGDGGNITISGGTVTATANYGAGIGGGNGNTLGGAGAIVNISGGTVLASSDYGTGIGGGAAGATGVNGGSGGIVTITGGIVTAWSRTAQDIGRKGSLSSEGTTVITGGSVFASKVDNPQNTTNTAFDVVNPRNLTGTSGKAISLYVDNSAIGSYIYTAEYNNGGEARVWLPKTNPISPSYTISNLNALDNKNGSISLSASVTPAGTYQWLRENSSGTFVELAGATALNYTNTGLTNGVTYNYRLGILISDPADSIYQLSDIVSATATTSNGDSNIKDKIKDKLDDILDEAGCNAGFGTVFLGFSLALLALFKRMRG